MRAPHGCNSGSQCYSASLNVDLRSGTVDDSVLETLVQTIKEQQRQLEALQQPGNCEHQQHQDPDKQPFQHV
ncbi:MAG: hypothetical protein OXC41_00915 [Gammaproteobacteria bacterium]|nr:hypothetical protein [Gammaproteobacteria bacterium]